MEDKPKNQEVITIPESESMSMNQIIKMQKSLKPDKSRALSFENDKQRNLIQLKKGITKPGVVSYEVLRRAAQSVPVARICITTLKEKVTKTKWLIKSIDPLAKVDDSHIKKVTDLLKNPNSQDTFREFMDKLVEDLLVLDSVAIEKTRYPDGELGALYYVDATTIRPVYDEYGNQDIPILLDNGHEPEVSYLQIFNNSQYGGPEAGVIKAAWPKKDFMYFHMHPQGSINNYGYGMSPIEGVLSVVNNLLNTDNFNGSYFDEGAFPPIILQLAEQLDQRQLEAYREYMYSEIAGNFHRPAIMAGGGELTVHNLKDKSNNDMQFMEYTTFLSKLMCAAFGLNPQDIGLTDDVGSKNVSETQKDLSEAKGYSSILNLIKEKINNDIILRDFGYEDLQFEWVAEDSEDPEVASTIYDLALKNGTMTVNEVREKLGMLPYEEWADQPLLLTGTGYVPIHTDSSRAEEQNDDVGGETVYQKSQMSKAIYTDDGFRVYMDDRGFGQPFIFVHILTGLGMVIKPPVAVNVYSQELEEEITTELSNKGLNVHPVTKMTFKEVRDEVLGPNPILQAEFDKYINMTSEYDSEKWRARNGGSRKYSTYMVSEFIDGFPLNSNQMKEDMKRDPTSYVQAITDLAALWNAEKEMMLGDRRADQYIITPDKRAFGFDYQFKGDFKRWEDSSTSIAKLLAGIPMLYNLFIEKTASKKETKKSIFKTMWQKITKGQDLEGNLVLFGELYPEDKEASIIKLFKDNDTAKVLKAGYTEISYNYDLNASIKVLKEFMLVNHEASGGIVKTEDDRDIRYSVYTKTI